MGKNLRTLLDFREGDKLKPMKKWAIETKRGFTLVELLIVIVVIAILASISTVAYSGIQNRAYASQLKLARSSYDKHFKMIYVEHSQTTISPTLPGSDNGVCIGSMEDYPATTQFPAGSCVVRKSTGAAETSVNSTINDEFRNNMSSIPNIPTDRVFEDAGYLYRGGYFDMGGWTVDFNFTIPQSVACPEGMSSSNYYNMRWCHASVDYN